MAIDKRHSRRKPLTAVQWVLLSVLMTVFLALIGTSVALAVESDLFISASVPEEAGTGDEETEDTFCYGIYIDGISVGGLTAQEARTRVEEKQKELVNTTSVRLYYKEKETILKLSDCIVSFDTDSVLQACMELGRNGTERETVSVIWTLPPHPVYYVTTMSVDPSPLQYQCVELAASLEGEAQDAQVLGFDGKMPEGERWITIPEKEGCTVDYEAMWAAVDASFGNRTFEDVEIQAQTVKPEVTLEELMKDKQLISEFSTTMTRDDNRTANIDLACSAISNLWLQPGEEFSFNTVVGPRTKANGYVEAGVIVGGDRLDDGLGGGICQVSGTLFNAVVMADLEISERYTHSFELSYLKRGRDATVDYGNKDFKFVNTLDCPVLIQMFTVKETRQCVAQIYGVKRTDGLTIDIMVDTLREIKPPEKVLYETLSTLEPGEVLKISARNGLKTQSYKVYKNEEGITVKKVELFRDEYPPIQAKIYYYPGDPRPSAFDYGGDSLD